MTLIQFYYDPTSEFDRLVEDSLAAQFCSRACTPSTEARHASPRNREVSVQGYQHELPGLTSEGVAIDVQQNRLTVSGESAAPDSSEEKRNYVVRERRSGKFSRTLQVLFGTKAEDVKARMENGILTITFPKTSPEQQAKRIVIQQTVRYNALVSLI
ncbi:HSP20-like chaperone [Imleria badia]|nr:HSP20-like chaperone [Imleria badia]